MNLILVNSNYPYFEAIKAAIVAQDVNLSVIDAPEEVNESFLSGLMQLAVSFKPDYLLSLDFIPYLSNACKVMNFGYIAWITGDYSVSSFDFSIRNEWNILFAADPAVCGRLKQAGCENVYYLPLAPLVYEQDIETALESMEEDCQYSDLPMIWTEGLNNRISVDVIMPQLKDSTKGYLDGFVEAHKNDLNLRAMFKRMHEYIRDDLTACYPQTPDSIETVAEMYDNRFLYPVVDASMGQVYLREFLTEQGAEGFVVVTDHDPLFDNPKVTWIRRDDPALPFMAVKAKYHIMIPGFASGGKITQDIWDVMAINGNVLLPRFVDTGIFGEHKPADFGDLRELDILISKNNNAAEFELEDEIQNRKKTVSDFANEQSYELRIKEMFRALPD